jgi:hypothetical protein
MSSIAERELTYRDDAGQERAFLVKVKQPRLDGNFWACEYELGAPTPFAGAAYGEDSLQALVLALHAVQAHLNTGDLRGRVRWLGEPIAELLSLPAL